MSYLSIRHHYSNFVLHIIKSQLAIGLFVATAVVCGQVYSDYRSNLNETQRIAIELRNGLLSGADVSTVQLCKMIFQAPGIIGVRVTSGAAELCSLTKTPSFFGYDTRSDIFFSADGRGALAGQVQIRFSLSKISLLIVGLSLILGVSWLVLLWLSSRAMKNIESLLIAPIVWLAEHFGGATELAAVKEYSGNPPLDEISRLVTAFNQMAERTLTSLQAQKEAEVIKVQLLLAKQVAHDIRSPLSALNMAATSLPNLPEERRELIYNAVARINTIANGLLIKGQRLQIAGMQVGPAQGLIRLAAVVEALLNEKRLQLTNMPIEIKADFADSSDALVLGNVTEIERLVSNLINNSTEARADRIVVSVRKAQDVVQLSIHDNGSGIDPALLDRLGTAGVSYGKDEMESGSGLGIYHAKRYVESIGGKFSIISQLDRGTIVQMNFPSA